LGLLLCNLAGAVFGGSNIDEVAIQNIKSYKEEFYGH
jgi:hypothetical protein